MEQAKLMGVGFMGKPERVTRVLNRLMEGANRVYDLPMKGNYCQASLSDTRPATGFYLGFTESGLNLSLFTKSMGSGPGKNHCITYSMKRKKDGLH